jgi:hypothetical protein
MDGFNGIHDPDKYKGIPPLNQGKMKMGRPLINLKDGLENVFVVIWSNIRIIF